MKVSEYDAARIACRALVAPSTVRRVLNGTPNVTAYSRTKVVEACRELRFPVPQAVADAEIFERDAPPPESPEPSPRAASDAENESR